MKKNQKYWLLALLGAVIAIYLFLKNKKKPKTSTIVIGDAIKTDANGNTVDSDYDLYHPNLGNGTGIIPDISGGGSADLSPGSLIKINQGYDGGGIAGGNYPRPTLLDVGDHIDNQLGTDDVYINDDPMYPYDDSGLSI